MRVIGNSLKSVAYNALLHQWIERMKGCSTRELTENAWCMEHSIKFSIADFSAVLLAHRRTGNRSA